MVENAIGRVFVKGSRRVIVPGVGAFIKRENGEVIFTDMLREDDGMLASSVVGIFGISEDKAREIVGHYALGLKRELQSSGRVAVNGIGILTLNSEGKYIIEPEDSGSLDVESIVTSHVSEPMASAGSPGVVRHETEERKAAAFVQEQDIQSNGDLPEESNTDAPADISFAEDSVTGIGVVSDAESRSVLSPGSAGEAEKTDTRCEDNSRPTEPAMPGNGRTNKSRLRSALYGDEAGGDDGEACHDGTAEGVSAPDAGSGKAGFVHTAEAGGVSSGSSKPNASSEEYAPQIHIRRPSKPKKRVDAVMVTAIIALLITLGVLLYGYLTKRDIDKSGTDSVRIELTGDSDAADIPGAPAE